ncbi:hypothetical protein JCM5353_004553 [Sporobolomyces roseus]
MPPTPIDSIETLKDTSKSSPLSSPRIPFPTRLSTTSLPSSPLATYVSTSTTEKSIGERKEESGKVGSKSKLGKFSNSPFFTPSPGYARRGSKSSIGTKGGLDETTMGIQAGAIGGGFSPYPSSTILSSSNAAPLNRRAYHRNGSDSAVDLFSPNLDSTLSDFDSLTPPRLPYGTHSGSLSTLTLSSPAGSSGSSGSSPASKSHSNLSTSALYYNDHKFITSPDNIEFDDVFFDDSADHHLYKQSWRRKTMFELLTLLALFLVVGAMLVLMLLYPVLRYGVLGTWVTAHHGGAKDLGWNIGGINSSGQVPKVNIPPLIDPDTPQESRTRVGFDGETYNLVFSDEFNLDGRTFFPGDDPYWEAVDLHYWATQDYEWYDPDAVTTKDGSLQITLSQEPIHDLNFRSGMLQSWNKLCFQGGIIEVSMSSPGSPDVMGFWPGVWTLGNLGRPGYGGTNDGVWPYSYSSCDVGTLQNQTFSNHTPAAAHNSGLRDYGGQLSYLRGQRLSACTCSNEDHPGPSVSVGRGAPEIDLTEQQVDYRQIGSTSQSIQFAPMDAGYRWLNETPHTTIFDPNRTFQNTFQGATFQQSASVITLTDRTSYNGNGYTRYGFEYEPGTDGQITWFVNETASWRILASAIGPNEETQIGQRLISEEPMAITINLAISKAFQEPDFENLEFPGVLRVDYIRVYQKGTPKLGCDPADHPTSDYISRHMDVYNNPNYTTWPAAFPRNRISEEGCAA